MNAIHQHDCPCGSNCTCTNCTCGSTKDNNFQGAEKVNISFPRSSNYELDQLEDKERQERLSHGVDPVLMGKHHKIQDELLLATNTTTTIPTLPSSSTISHAAEVVKDKAVHLMSSTTETASHLMSSTTETASHLMTSTTETASGLTETLSNLTGNMMGKMSEYVEVAKEKIGMTDPSSIASINRAEEAERARRMNEKVDPIMEGKKHRVESELLKNVKTSN